jgi:sporulation and spore germination protein/immunoglobulin-like protein involved in spore germination
MRRWALVVGVVAAVAIAAVVLVRGRGGHHGATTTGTATTAVRAYFYRGSGLVPVRTLVPRTPAIGTAAVDALLAGPPPGYETEIPSGTRLLRLSIADGTATATLSPAFAAAPRTARAQLVYTLTQFPTVRRVVLAAGAGRRSATRADYLDLTPSAPIFVAVPRRDSTVTSPIHASGTAVVFEATLVMDVRSGGRLVTRKTITASRGGPYRGTWSTTAHLAPGDYELVFYEPSAENGEPLHSTTVPITVAP